MPASEVQPAAEPADREYQREILRGVSRTFALTIPELPDGLRDVVSNGYLLCRIADTIEDDPALPLEEKRRFHDRFARVVEGEESAEALAAELWPRLAPSVLLDERDLIANMPRVIRVTHAFNERQRRALSRCVRTMCDGMGRFQGNGHGLGLHDVAELHAYCYYVAGVVGEMLTELFCDYSPEIDARREALQARTVSFGQGLQMTNVLKDIWDDLERGFCWLPRDVFDRSGFDLDALSPQHGSKEFERGLGELISIAHGHLKDALDYTLLIPRGETGIRHFCLWALGMAVLTLRKIDRHRDFSSSRQVKITRRTVKATVLVSNLVTRSDRSLRVLFSLCAAGLPRPSVAWSARP